MPSAWDSTHDRTEGAPATTTTAPTALGDAEFGVWEITAGTVRDTETDEVFVVTDGGSTRAGFRTEFGRGKKLRPLAAGAKVGA